MTLFSPTKYLVDGSIGGQGTVKDGELPLQSLWDVVTAPTRMDHGCQKLDVHDIGELTWFLQIVEAILLHHLPDNLVCHLCGKVHLESLRNVVNMCHRNMYEVASNLKINPVIK